MATLIGESAAIIPRELGAQLAPAGAYCEAVFERCGLGLRSGRGGHRGCETSLKWADKRAGSTAAHLAKVQGESPGRHCGALGGRAWVVMDGD